MNALAVETERAISRRGSNQERCAELDARSAAAQAELERAQAQLLSLTEEVQTNRALPNPQLQRLPPRSMMAGSAAVVTGRGHRAFRS